MKKFDIPYSCDSFQIDYSFLELYNSVEKYKITSKIYIE